MHPAQDFIEETMSFGVLIQENPCLITSNQKLFSFENAKEEAITLKHQNINQSRFPSKGISAFIEANTLIDVPQLYRDIFNYVKRFIHFPSKDYLYFISLWVIGTYFFMVFRYYPYVWLNAEKGSGKTLLMEILSKKNYNGGSNRGFIIVLYENI